MTLISVLAIPFFNINDNIRWGYLMGVIIMLLSAAILFSLFLREKKNSQLIKK